MELHPSVREMAQSGLYCYGFAGLRMRVPGA